MLQIQLSPLPSSKSDQLKAWLASENLKVLEHCIKNSIADLQMEAIDPVMNNPLAFLRKDSLSPDGVSAMAKACKLKIFLDVLSEIVQGEIPLNSSVISVKP